MSRLPHSGRARSGLAAFLRSFAPLLALAIGANAQVFTSPSGSPFGVGNQPYSVVFGDFNGDGKLDLATANNTDGTVTVRLGAGDGTFPTAAPNSPYTVGSGPSSLAVGDFNGDGIQDLVVTNSNGITVNVLLGGASGMTVGSPIMVGDEPSAVTVGDFNGDGIPDLAVVNQGDNNVTILLGDGTGNFTPTESPVMVGGSPSAIAIGDFNGDGKPDLVIANFGDSTITVLLGDGTGNFNPEDPMMTGAGPVSVVVWDYNHDGKQDIAIANENDNDITVLVGDGAGNFMSAMGSPFGAESGVGNGPDSLAVGDFDADGFPDLAVSNYADGSLAVLLNNGRSGGFTPASGSPFMMGPNPRSIAAADLNGDHRVDLAYADSGGADVAILLNSFSQANQTISFDTIPNYLFGVSPFPVAAQSSSLLPVSVASITPAVCTTAANLVLVTGTGTCSITATQGGNTGFSAATPVTQSFNVSVATPSGTLVAAPGPFPEGTNPGSAVIRDFNGDGFQDIAILNGNSVTVLLGSISGIFTAATNSPFATGSSPQNLAAGDFNGDGKLDLASVNQVGNDITVLLGDGTGNFTPAPGNPFRTGAGAQPVFLVVGDFNGDGIEDLATANQASSNVTVLLGNGAGGFTANNPIPVGSHPESLAVGDFNGDGIQDLATANSVDGNVTVLLGDGTGNFSPATSRGSPFTVGSEPFSIVVGDFNGDGSLDLAAANFGDDTVTVLLGDGTGHFAPATAMGSPFMVGSGPVSIAAGDFNGDGKQDLVTVNENDNTATVLLGNGSGGFTQAAGSPFPVGTTPSLAVGDVNGDGIEDLAVVNPGGGGSATLLLGALSATSAVLSTTSPLTIPFGQSVPLNLAVSDTGSAFNALTGMATFKDGSNILGTANQTTSPYTFNATALAIGTHTLTGVFGGGSGSAASPPSNTITINVLQAQTISFGGLSDQTLGVEPFMISATSTSGLTVSFASNTSSVCTVSVATVTINTTGTCSITASQPGDGVTYAAATPVTRTFMVNTGNSQTISFDTIPNQIFGVSPFAVAAQSSALLPVTFASITPSVCTTSTDLVLLLNTGTCSITASAASMGPYGAATPVTNSFVISPAIPSGTLTSAAYNPLSTGAAPDAIAVGDFNGDGIPDLVTANDHDNNVTVLLGNISGGFTAGPNSPIMVGNEPASVAVGDFNGDGIQDLAVGSSFESEVQILLGDGSGGFTVSGSPVTVGTVPGSIVVGDFNGDGIQDLAVANAFSNNISVLLGNGSGGFEATAMPISVGNNPYSMVVADFDGDGKQDLAAANYGDSTVTVLKGDGTGGFTPFPGSPISSGSGSSPLYITVGDFDGNGKPDLATANDGNSTVTVLLGDGTGNFSQPLGSPFGVGGGGPFSVVAGDFNGDGIQDLATSNFSTDNVSVLLGDGTGEFAPAPGSPFSVGSGSDDSIFLGVADFNQDGIEDLAVSSFNNDNVTVLLGAVTPTTSLMSTTSPLSIISGQTVPLTLTVSDTGTAFNSVTGTVSFNDGATMLGFGSQGGNVYTFTASGLALGSHALTAVYSGGSGNVGSTSNTVTIQVLLSQMITFNPLNNVTIGVAPFTINASASSTLTVSFASNSLSVCTVNGATVTILTTGMCSITASQAGNGTYAAATPVTNSFTVNSLTPQTITFNQPLNVTLGVAPFSIASYASASSGLPVQFASNSMSICTATGANGATITVLTGGTCSITASQPGDGVNYAAATPVTQTFLVSVAVNTFNVNSTPDVDAGATINGQTVDCTTAGHPCTLRAAFTQQGNIINLPAGTYSLTQTLSGQPQNALKMGGYGTVSVVGAGAAVTIIDNSANAGSRFIQEYADTLSLSGLTIQNSSQSQNGGAIYGGPAALSLNNVVLQNNTSSGGQGGAIYTAGPTTIGNSTFYNNTAQFGGAIYLDNTGGNAALTVTNSTFVGNAATGQSNTIDALGPVAFVNVTVLGDLAPGSQVASTGATSVSAGGGIMIESSILAYNSGANCGGTITSLGYNLSDDNTCGATQKSRTQLALDTGGLANNGGPTPTVAILAGSAAIDFVSPSACPPPDTDQTGATRPQGSSCDSGAFEFSSSPPMPQTLMFHSQPNMTLGIPPFSIAPDAVTTSELAIQFASNTTSVCTATGTNGATITLLTAGTCSLLAYQPGNGTYEAATPVTQTFLVLNSQTITFNPLSDVTIGVSPFTISATATSNLTVSFTSNTMSVCTVNVATVTILTTGNCSLTASQPGDGVNYAAATPVTNSFQVNSPTPQSITFDTLQNQIYGFSPFVIAAQATSLLPVTFVSNSPTICKLAGDLVIPLGTGSCSITASQGGNGTFAPAAPYPNSFIILAAPPSGTLTQTMASPITVGSLPLAAAAGVFVNGSGNQDLAVVNQGDGTVTILLGDGSGGFMEASGSPIMVGTSPRFVAVGDFNGDNALDLAVVNQGDDNVTILLGNGTGGFTPQEGTVGVGSSPTSVVVGDFNGDGIQDLAVTNQDDDTVTVLLGDGTGNFEAVGEPVSVGTSPLDIVVGDFNGDGKQDLATANLGDVNVTVLLGDGSGGFMQPMGSPFAAGSAPAGLVVGDFNADGKQDLAVADLNGDNVNLLLGDGMGNFTASVAGPFPVGGGPIFIVAADINGDGIPDVATANDAGSVSVLLGDGMGGFTTAAGSPFPAGTAPYAIVTGDFNRDGISDLATANVNSDNVTVLLGGLSATSSLLSTSSPLSIILGQSVPLNVVVSNTGTAFNPPTGITLINDGSNTIGAAGQTSSPYTFTAAGLALGSHALTAVYGGGSGSTGSTSNTITIQVLQSQTISFGMLSNVNYGVAPFGISATATSGLTVSFTSNTPSVCTVNVATVTILTTGTCTITASQAGDGVNYAAAAPVPQSFMVSLGTQIITFDAIPNQIFGMSPFAVAAQSSALLPVSFASTTPGSCTVADDLVELGSTGTCSIMASQGGNGDYNGATPVTRSFNVTQANPAGTLTPAANSPFPTGNGPANPAVGDFNGDGKPDLAITNSSDGTVTVLLGDGMGGFTEAMGSPVPVGVLPVYAAVGDFNGDGYQDLAVPHVDAQTLTVLLGNGMGGFTEAVGSPFPTGGSPVVVVVGDFNGDGIQDVAMSNVNNSNVTVMLGNGSGGFAAAPGSPFPTGAEPSIAVGDFNGDGIEDIAVLSSQDSNVTILLGAVSGGFTMGPGGPFPTGGNPNQIVVGDFNGDGKQDLATANFSGNDVTVLLGTGTGAFNEAMGSPFTTGGANTNPVSLVVTDLNGDGIEDLAVTNQNSNNLTVLLGDGMGGFAPAAGSPFPVGTTPIFVSTADFNQDGIPDLAVSNDNSNNVTVLLGTLTPTSSVLSTTSPLSIISGQSVPLNLAVSDTGTAFNTLSGTATFMDGSNTLGTASQNGSPYTFTASSLALGSHALTAVYGGGSGSAGSTSNTITIQVLATQTITFNPLNNVTIGVSPFGISATATSNLTVSFASNTLSVCTVNVATVTILTTGTCSITASQPGDGVNYAAATPVTRTFTVLNTQTITFNSLSNVTIGVAPFGISATATSNLTVSFASNTLSVCTVNVATVTILTTGTCSITASQPGDGVTYAAASPVTRTFTVLNTQTITFNPLSNVTIGVAPFGIGATSTSSLTVSFASNTLSVCTVNVATVTILTTGTCSITASQPGDGVTYAAAAPVTRTFIVLNTQTITFNPLSSVTIGVSPFGISATATSNLTVSFASNSVSVCTVNVATVTILTTGSCSITASQPGDGVTYGAAAPVTRTFMVNNPSPQNITFDAIPNQIFGISPFPIAAQSSSLLPVSFASTTTPVCTIADDLVTLLTAGMCSITSTQGGNVTFSAATPVTQSFMVIQASRSGMFVAATGSPFAVGSNPDSVAAGDFNEDGIPDLAVANYTSNNVTVLLGSISGGYTQPMGSPYAAAAGGNPYSVAVGDFNGDGHQDIAVASVYSDNVTVLLGDGMGGFAPAQGSPFPVGSQPFSITVGDFNQDGIQDLATANAADDNVTVLLGNGSGGFTQPMGSPFPAGNTPETIVVGDFNLDGKPDLATANVNSNNVTVLLGDGLGGFAAAMGSPITVGTNPFSVAVGDFNGDGKPDLAAANHGDSTVTVLLGDGMGGFSQPMGSPVAAGEAPFSVVAGDFNGDGKPDLAVGNGSVIVLLGDGLGGFAQAPGSFGVGIPMVVADFNGDGIEDLAGPDTTGTVTVLLGALSPTSSVLSTTSPLSIIFGQSVPLNLAVSDTGTAFNILTGTATFMDGSNTLGTASQNGSPYTFTASGLALGSHALTAVYGGGSGSGGSTSNTVTIQVLATQTITFNPLSNVTIGVSPFGISATATSNLTVSFASNSLSVCTVNVATVTILTPGTCSITASQAGDGVTYAAAAPVTRTFIVLNTQTITFNSLSNVTIGVSPFGIGATTTSNLTVSFASNSLSVCTVNVATVTILTTGTCSITASQPGDGVNYAAASPVTRTFTVLNTQTITFNPLSNVTNGVAPFGISATATSNLTVNFASNTLSVCTVNVATVTILTTGSCSITASQPGDGVNYAAAAPVTRTFTVLNTQTITFNPLSNVTIGVSPFGIGATTTSNLTVSFASNSLSVCTVNVATVTILTPGTCSITASQPGDGVNYAAATPVTRTFTVLNTQTITFNPLSNVTIGVSPFGISATSTSNLTVSFASNNLSVCTVNVATVTILTTGTCSITASQPGDGVTYAAAAPVTRTFTVLNTQTITFNPLSNVTIGVAPFGISATSTSSLTVSFASNSLSVCTVNVATVTILTTGTCSITASQAGDGVTYAAAAPVTRSFTVNNPGSQTITFDAIPNQIFGVSPFPIAAQSSALLPVSFASTTTAVCTNADDLVILLSAGTCSITATQGGNITFSAATPVTRSFTVNKAKPSSTFTPAAFSPLTAGTSPYSAAIADLNGDGFPDIAIANQTSGNLTVLLGSISGTFSAAPNSPFPAGSEPSSVVVGDFNGDGFPDLATANFTSDNVTVLLGDGTGNFNPAVGSPFGVEAGTGPYSVVVGDFNGDGIQDLATANFNFSRVTVLLGDGTGGFTEAINSPFAVFAHVQSVVVGDFNGDGKLDLATADTNTDSVTVLLGDGTGNFAPAMNSPFAVGSNPLRVVAADFNGDGKLDLATTNNNDNNVTVLLGDGMGNFSPAMNSPFAVGSAPVGIVAGDFNGDGKPDLAVTNSGDGTVTVLLGNGSGGFAPATSLGSPFRVGTTPVSIAVGDLNGDGTEDLAVANSAGKNVTVLLNGTPVVVPPVALLTITLSPGSISTTTGGSVAAGFSASGGTLPYRFSVGGQPAGVTLGSGSLAGSPTQPGTFNATVTVTDANMSSASASITINVLGLTTTTLPNGTTGQFYAASIGAAGGTSGYSFSATGLPAGLSLSSYGYLSGTVATAGTYPLSVTVSSGGLSVGGTLSVTIAQPQALSIPGATLPNGMVSVLYSQGLGATGGLQPYTWSVISGAPPKGLSMNVFGIVSGTPATPGSFSFGVQVTDASGATATAAASITIQAAPLLITTQSLPEGMAGVPYPQLQIAVSGGVSPYVWALGNGTSLPPGYTFSADGVLNGPPAAAGTSSTGASLTNRQSADTTGTFSIGITVTDHANTQVGATFPLTIRPSSNELILTSSSLTFVLPSPATNPPASQVVGVQSTVPTQPIAYTLSASPPAPWLALANGTTTPDSITVSITSAALTLAPGPYQTTIFATCSSSFCSGTTQTVLVNLTVTAEAPNLEISTGLVSFATSNAALGSLSQPINVKNAGGGSLGFASVSCEAAWCSVGPSPASLAGGVGAAIPVTVDPSRLSPGFYRTQVDIATSGGIGAVPVTLFISANATMTLAPAGALFNMPAGSAPGNPTGGFLVSVNSSSPVNFSAAVLSTTGVPAPGWLVLGTPGGSASSTQPGTVSFSIDPVAAGALAPGAYYGEIQISSADLSNSPEDFEVVLNVTAANAPQAPDPEPGGLLFITPVGGVLPPQTVTVYSGSSAALTFQASAATTGGGNWLSVTPDTGSASTGVPGVTTVNVDASSLNAGVYQGGVSYSLSATAVRTVNVTLIVTSGAAGGGAAAASAKASPRAAGCTPSVLVPAQTGLVNSFSQPAGWPTPLAIVLANDCGATVNNGQIVATFSNGDPPLALPLVNPSQGLYSGTWAPVRASAEVAINVTASAPGYPAATSQIAGAVVPNAVPVLTPNGTLHSFDPLVGAALAPGTIVAIYGQNLAAAVAQPTTIPLPTTYNGTLVIVGGKEAPLYYVSPGQINAQVPFELQPGSQYDVIVSANGALTNSQPIQLAAATPGLAAFSDGTLIAQHSDGTLVSQTSPARGGEYLVAYLAGLGDTTVPVASGAASPSSPLAQPTETPTLTINGAPYPILFAGLTPGLVGLYQMNFQVPSGLAAGNIAIVVSQNGQASNQTILPYEP